MATYIFFMLTVTLYLLTMVTSISGTICPDGCTCTTSHEYKKMVTCRQSGLSRFPQNIERDTTYLDLRYNNIARLTIIDLAPLENLEFLQLDHNLIADIEPYVFRHLKHVKLISLRWNRLTIVKKFTFSGVGGAPDCMKTMGDCSIDISANTIEKIESNAFEWIENLSINISNIYQQTTFEPYSFYGATNIPKITIENIPGLILSKFWASDMDNIGSIFIKHSSIATIGPYFFEGLKKVEEITFINCNFGTISEYGFSGIKFKTGIDKNLSNDDAISYETNNLPRWVYYPEKTMQNKGGGGRLTFSNCEFFRLKADILRDTNIGQIFIEKSLIKDIGPNTFRGLECLNHIYIKENTFTKGLTENSFGSIKHIKELIFEDNNISAIHNNAFSETQGVGKLIIKLGSRSNMTLQSFSFRGLLDVYSLQIVGVNPNVNSLFLNKYSFSGVVDLNNITISNVNIPTCTEHSFHGMGKVNTLNIIETRIDPISCNAFESHPILTAIQNILIKDTQPSIKCTCENLQHASYFDSMFLNHNVSCLHDNFNTKQFTSALYKENCIQDSKLIKNGATDFRNFSLVIISLVVLFCYHWLVEVSIQ